MKKIIFFSSLIILAAVSSCKKDNPIPPEDQPHINLMLEDVSCTEAWIKLTTANINLPDEVIIKQDDSAIQTISLSSSDSLLYIDSLLPNHTYEFQSVIQSNNQSSNSLNVTTMDTTSHEFTWQTWTFGGQAGSCNLYDVAIINENNIWAVGEIFLNDSLGSAIRYNAVHWNGNNWEIEHIPYYYQGQPFYNPIPSVFAFSINDIWFCGNGVIHWDGNQYNPVPIPTNAWGAYQMNKIRGTSGNYLYVVGNNGNIAHYLNGHWSKIESGTNMSLVDMAGTSGDNVFICGSDANNVKGIILKKNNSGFEVFVNSKIVTQQEIFHPDLFGSLPSIWLDEKNTLYAAGNLLYQYKFGKWDYVHSLPENYIGGNPGVYYRGYIVDVKGVKSNDM